MDIAEKRRRDRDKKRSQRAAKTQLDIRKALLLPKECHIPALENARDVRSFTESILSYCVHRIDQDDSGLYLKQIPALLNIVLRCQEMDLVESDIREIQATLDD